MSGGAAAAAAAASIIAMNSASRSGYTGSVTEMPFIIEFAFKAGIAAVLLLVLSLVLMAIVGGLKHIFPDKRERYRRRYYGQDSYDHQVKPYFLDQLDDLLGKFFGGCIVVMVISLLLALVGVCWSILFG